MLIDLVVLGLGGVVRNDRMTIFTAINNILKARKKPEISEEEFCTIYSADFITVAKRLEISDHREAQKLFYKYLGELPQPEPIPDAIKAVREISNSTPVAVFDLQPTKELEDDIKRYGLGDCIKIVFGNANKQTLSDFHRLLDEAKSFCKKPIRAENTLYCTSMENDITLAHRLDAQSVAIVNPSYSYHSIDAIQKAKPKYIVEHISNIIPILKNSH